MSIIQDRISFFENKIYESLNVPTYESFKIKSDKRLQKQKHKQKEAQAKKERYLKETEKQAKENMSKVLRKINALGAAERKAKKGKASLLKQISTLGGGLSQGFNLISKEKLSNAKDYYNEYRNNPRISNGENDTLDIMFNCLKNDALLTQYLDEKYQEEINNGSGQLSYGARQQLNNVRFKTKQLFILYKSFIEAQVELLC